MKYLSLSLAALALFFSLTALSAPRPLTFTELVLERTTNAAGHLYLVGSDSVRNWCSNRRSGISIDSYAAAKTIEGLENGLHLCKGEFVNTPGRSVIQIFSIEECSVQDPERLRMQCPK